jgi:serine/threonine protein phosphatase PrpC
VLCTDGVHDNLTLSRMQAIAADDADPTTLPRALAHAALQRARAQDGHAHPDDITCVALAL